MSKGQKLRALVNERLTAAAEEIFALFERTIAEYEEEVHTLKQRNNTQQQHLLDQVLEPRVLLHRTGVQLVSVKSGENGECGAASERPTKHKKPEENALSSKQRGVQIVSARSLKDIKEEPEEEQLQEFSFTPVFVKTEDDEDKSPVLHERPTEENREETNGEECGAEAGCSSYPLMHLHSDSKGHSSDHTDHSEDWTQDEPPLITCSSLINPDSSERDAGKNSKRHKCSECEKRFLSKQILQRHMLIHTGEKPFKCSVCQKEFSQICNLRSHMRSHTGEKPFSCSVCQKGFTLKHHLIRHLKTHSGAGALSPEGGEGSEPKSDSDVHVRDQSEPTPTDLDF